MQKCPHENCGRYIVLGRTVCIKCRQSLLVTGLTMDGKLRQEDMIAKEAQRAIGLRVEVLTGKRRFQGEHGLRRRRAHDHCQDAKKGAEPQQPLILNAIPEDRCYGDDWYEAN